MNSNLVHNAINIAGLVLAGTTAALLSSGCTTIAATGNLDCSQSRINPTYTAIAIPVLFGLKLAINIGRDGFTGLTKPQPPVQK